MGRGPGTAASESEGRKHARIACSGRSAVGMRRSSLDTADGIRANLGKHRSSALTDGPARAGARAMLKAAGFSNEDLARPLVGVATSWIETMPCNLNQRELAQMVKQGVRRAGGTPVEFNTIAISDGVAMGTDGMNASLISREIIADSIELVARGHLLDALVCLSVATRRSRPPSWLSPASTYREWSCTEGR